ncbi:MAG TPA: hypothetical protein PK850_04830 [Ignavibacteria bacterium]|nr:hypothetical protein [Ignavibacteria bacterium]HRF65256.1 hypothetical protein [Ignavibacteria bacterium]HRF65260.1 hypothetical protein [Ignavibacteria bacterium]
METLETRQAPTAANYIHANPIRGKWNLCKEFTDYKYSSAAFYYNESEDWDFLTHYADAGDE